MAAERLDDQHRVMRHQRPPALADDDRMRHLLRVAHVHEVVDDVARVLLERVVRARIERRARPVVIDPQAAAHVHVADLVAHLHELAIKPRRLAHGLLDRADVGHLAADVEMHELEAMREPVFLEEIARPHEVRRGQAELRVLPTAGRPLAGGTRLQAHPQTHQWLDAHFLGNLDDLAQFLDLLDDHDDLLAQLAAHQRVLDEHGVLVTVADDDALQVAVHSQRGEEFRLAAALQPEVVFRARVEDFLHDLTQLVDLDRENAAVRLLVAGLRDGAGERLADRLHAVAQEVLETDDQREAVALFARFLHDGHHVDGRALVLQGRDLAIALRVDRKIPAPQRSML